MTLWRLSPQWLRVSMGDARVSDELRKLRLVWKLSCKVRMSRMKVKRGYKAELDLNNEQVTFAKKHCGAARWACNYALARKKANYQQGLHTPYAAQLHR